MRHFSPHVVVQALCCAGHLPSLPCTFGVQFVFAVAAVAAAMGSEVAWFCYVLMRASQL